VVTLFLALPSVLMSAGNDNVHLNDDGAKVSHTVGFNLRPSYVIPTHGFYNGWNPAGEKIRFSGSVHADYSFTFSEDSEYGKIYPGAYQGVGIGAQTFFAHDLIGTPLCLYVFQGAPIARLAPQLTFDYEWNLGLSAGWNTAESMITASRMNVYINVGLFLNWRFGGGWNLQFGPEYSHFSNGDTKFPNGGANTVNFRLGLRRQVGADADLHQNGRPALFARTLEDKTFAERITYDLMAYGAWRADRMVVGGKLHIIDEAFPLAGVQFNPLYHFNRSLSAGPSLDLMYDGSANLIAHIAENDPFTYSHPSFIRQCAAGLSLRGEIKMPIFAVNIGMGYNFSYTGSELTGLYGVFALKAFLTDSIFLNIGYRLSSVQYAHNLMFGLGWRI